MNASNACINLYTSTHTFQDDAYSFVRLSCASIAYSDIAEGGNRLDATSGKDLIAREEAKLERASLQTGENEPAWLKAKACSSDLELLWFCTQNARSAFTFVTTEQSNILHFSDLAHEFQHFQLSTFQDGTTTNMPLQPPRWAQETFCDEDLSKKNRWQP